MFFKNKLQIQGLKHFSVHRIALWGGGVEIGVGMQIYPLPPPNKYYTYKVPYHVYIE